MRYLYDLIGKIAEATILIRKIVAVIFQGIRADKISMYKYKSEEFIAKTICLIKEQKAIMIVDYISMTSWMVLMIVIFLLLRSMLRWIKHLELRNIFDRMCL